jgi:hypothetical protein
MSFLKKILSFVEGGDSREARRVHTEYVRCSRCREKISVRVDLDSELTPQYDSSEGAYYVRKGVFGSGETRCFQMIEVELFFDSDRHLVSRYISGGDFITKDEFSAQKKKD